MSSGSRCSTSCTSARCSLAVIGPVFSYTGTIRRLWTGEPGSSSRTSASGLLNCSTPAVPDHLPVEHDR